MKTFTEIENEPAVQIFLEENKKYTFGDIVNGNTDNTAVDVLLQIYDATTDGCTCGTQDELEVDFFYSYNDDGEMIEGYSTGELCRIMGLMPITLDEPDYDELARQNHVGEVIEYPDTYGDH